MTPAPPRAPSRPKAKKRKSAARMVIIGVVVMMVTSMTAAWFITHKTAPKDHANPADVAGDHLNRPGLSHDDVKDWVLEVIPNSTRFTSNQFYNQLATLEPYYTKEGWKYYRGMLERYDVVKLLKKATFSVSPQVDGDPEFLEEGVDNKVFYWKVKLKMTLIMRSESKRLDQPMAAHIRLVRVPREFRDDGVAIASLNFLPIGPAVPVPQ